MQIAARLLSLLVISLLFSCLANSNGNISGQTSKPAVSRDILVGAIYFAGWWPEQPNKWQDPVDRHDWRKNYPERVPLLGDYNTQSLMDKEIVAAAGYNVDFFMMLWYPDTREFIPRQKNLNRGLEYFMASPNSGLMKFVIEYCNHPPFHVVTDEEWNGYVKTWVNAMKHPSYLRVGNRLVFKVHDAGSFLKGSGNSVDTCLKRITRLRQKVREAGLGEMVIGGGSLAIIANKTHWGSKVFDFSCDYNSSTNLPRRESDYPYKSLADSLTEFRNIGVQNVIPYMPFITAGYNPRPWKVVAPTFVLPTRDEWKQELKRVYREMILSKNLGIPLPDGTVQKAFTIYAWNEFGEGGFIAPTKKEGYMKLEGIRDVFGRK